jgi:hypothetical protein
MNHDRDGSAHAADHACEYQKQFDNRDYLCRVSRYLFLCQGSWFLPLCLVIVGFSMTGVVFCISDSSFVTYEPSP